MKKNYKMIIQYDGTRYYGWEHQPDQEMTIQGKLETVLPRMTEAPEDKPVTVIGAGRTDAGVHARAMTANVLLDTELSPEEIQEYMNRYLPEDIAISEVKICSDRFHSRYKAKGKTYCYTCYYGPSKPVFDRKYVTVLESQPDLERMRSAAELLKGMHDYRNFCVNPRMKKSTVRVVDSIEIKAKNSYIRFYYHGNGFLQNMVRIMTGTLLEVGYGRMEPEEITEILNTEERRKAGPTAPAKGLCLMSVDYD